MVLFLVGYNFGRFNFFNFNYFWQFFRYLPPPLPANTGRLVGEKIGLYRRVSFNTQQMREMDKILNNSKLPEPTKVQSKVVKINSKYKEDDFST